MIPAPTLCDCTPEASCRRHAFADPCRVLARHLAEARATPVEITLTRHDVEALVRIANAWNAERVRARSFPLSLSDVLRNVLEATAGLVARKEDG